MTAGIDVLTSRGPEPAHREIRTITNLGEGRDLDTPDTEGCSRGTRLSD